ncbi:peptidase inhibitor family I36 protein [Streptomyces uncialis]|uniref:peptidase inhibitor family I36 protein n=1 Tax=Streptomyces uncialis TaxID=1048205 RepID=UPI0022589812|nr:peptidase inhibitor family I36 protein [Streptomyces uncialis]MCX4663627.1 peptidase inhibitor family I36 protein [Streptomyces uncialis]
MRTNLLLATAATATALALAGPVHTGVAASPSARPADAPHSLGTTTPHRTAGAPAARNATTPAAMTRTTLGACGPGELCLWSKPDFKGTRTAHDLSEIDIESCVPLPQGTSAQSLANRLGRPVTTYQSGTCDETGEFDTYPGDGTWTPQSPHRIRAFKVWEN